MKTKEFFKFNGLKLIILLIIPAISYFISILFGQASFKKCTALVSENVFETIFRCGYDNSVFLLIKGILISPIAFLNGFISYYINIIDLFGILGILIIFILQIAYWYLLACLIFFIFKKIISKK